MSLYQQLKYSAGQRQKLAREREALWPPPIVTFSQMGKYEKPQGTSDKDDKKDAERYVKFEVPLNNADPASDKYKRIVRIYDDGKAFDWCLFQESTNDLFDVFGCAGNETYQKYRTRKLEGADVITHHKLIVIPKSLQKRIVALYHHYLAHPGMTRLEATLRETMTWPNMRKDVESHVRTCPQCQKYKIVRPKYGKLPEKHA
jgi:hypothetical protein